MNTLKTLTISTIKMYVRNKQNLFFALFMPLVIMVIFGLIGFDKVPKTKIGIVAPRPTVATQAFIDQLKKIDVLQITRGNESDLRASMKKGDLAVIMLVPNDFLPDIQGVAPPMKGVKPPTLPPQIAPKTMTILENVAQLQQAKTAEMMMSQILDKTTLGIVKAPTLFTMKTEQVSVKSSKYIDFLLPGIVGLSLMQMAVFGVAFVFADYKEKGVLKRLLATPMRPFQFVTAQVITRLMTALAQTAILIVVGMMLYHTHLYGAWWLVGIIAILGSIMFLGLGFTISGIATSVDSVPAIANLVVFPMMFLGGTFFPTDSMPSWLQHIVQYLPLQYLTHSLREVMANGAAIGAVKTDLFWMAGWSVILVGLAMYTFRLEEKRV